MLEFVQVRRCDGQCCRESPRFPNADHSDCVFHKASNGKETGGCMLMTGERTLSREASIKYKRLDAQGIFDETCVAWPQRNSVKERGDTGGCCWQLVDDGN